MQSIPTVFAFVDGQPVDGFMGALPESQIKTFIDRLAGPARRPASSTRCWRWRKESLKLGDLGGAAQAFAQALQIDPDNAKAIGGLARVYLAGGDAERAARDRRHGPGRTPRTPNSTACAPPWPWPPRRRSATAAEFEQRLAADPDDHEARLDLAKALAGARRPAGRGRPPADHHRDATATGTTARRASSCCTVFEAAGPASDVAKTGRRRLSSILFS